MKTIELQVEIREGVGKKPVKALRRQGKIPAILYGRELTPTPLAVGEKELFEATHTKAGANALIGLKIGGPKAKRETTCLIKEVQRDPVSDAITHVDFAAVSLTEKIRVNVHLVVRDIEESLGVKEGGVLDQVHHEIEVECLPTQIPDRIEVSVKSLKIGDSIHVKDLSLPSGVTPLLEPDEVVIALHPPRKEEEVAPLPAAEGVTEPEVIEKGKKEKPEEGAEAAPEKPEKAEKPEKK
jgi:large subunit ribosomal protein L25